MSEANDLWDFEATAEKKAEPVPGDRPEGGTGTAGSGTGWVPPKLSSISPSVPTYETKGAGSGERTLAERFDTSAYYASLRSSPRKPWIVPGILREGLTLFAGAPKAGKSFISLDIAFAVAIGGLALGGLVAHQGSVLYLAMEDHSHRVAARMELLEPDVTEWPWYDQLLVPTADTLEAGDRPSALIRRWVEETDHPTLLIVDTLGRLRNYAPTVTAGGYQEDVRALDWLQRFSLEHHLATLVVHHSNQSGKDTWKDDWATKIGGTSGLTGTADALWLLDTDRGEPTGRLLVGGRDLPDRTVSLTRVGPWWQATSDVPDDSAEVMRMVGQSPGVAVSDLAFLLQMPLATVRRYLSRLRMGGRVEERLENRWWPTAPVDERGGA